MVDGLLGKCKLCCISDAKQNRKTSTRVHEYDRERAKTPESKNFVAEAQRRRRKEHPEKMNAYNKVSRAIKSGVLIRQNCFCGKYGEAHHDDYSKPLEVLWLCKKHHEERHAELGWG